jgi:hypothetical protein
MAVLPSIRSGKSERMGEAIDSIRESYNDIVITIYKTDELLRSLERSHRVRGIP